MNSDSLFLVENATREIMWNVGSPLSVTVMYVLLAIATLIGGVGIFRRWEFWASGQSIGGFRGQVISQLGSLLGWGALQRGTVREPVPALAHTLVYIGFLVLLLTTTVVMLDHDFGFDIYRGSFYLALTLGSDIFGLGLIFGCAVFAYRRYVERPDLLHNRLQDAVILGVLVLLAVQGFLLEGLRIHAVEDPWRWYSPVGLAVARFFWPISSDAAAMIHAVVWWFHTLTVFAVVALAPYTKFFHIIASSANLFFRRRGPARGVLSYPGDIAAKVEAGEEFSIGLGTIKDYSWKQLLDLDACTSCGRCQDNCPAYLSGKPLSPKWMILDTRNHALGLHAQNKLAQSKVPAPLLRLDTALLEGMVLAGSGLQKVEAGAGWKAAGEYRGKNVAVQTTPLEIGARSEALVAGEIMSSDVFWSCTTCMACVEVCPVGINHVDQIVNNRRNMALMRGEIPNEAQAALRALENRGNPYGPAEDRANWLAGLDVPILKPGDSVDYLYWVGCVSAYDPRKQKIARSLVGLMNAAGLSYGVLGNAEGCTGDPARRLGEENLFQTLAKNNIELLRSLRFKTIVANCPHCFNSLKNEYPSLGNLADGKTPEIIHHSQLLKRLLKEGRLAVKPEVMERVTFHDPCYLGRYNDEYDAPREVVKSVSRLPIVEMERSGNKAMCCGAGGGHFFMDLKQGERVNVLRTDQAAATGAATVATACPFCMQMMEDGVKLTNREESLAVKDIAELMFAGLEKGEGAGGAGH